MMLQAKDTLSKIGKNYGYMIEPYILRPLFKWYLDKNHSSKMNVDRARNLVDVFLVLCNESSLYNSFVFGNKDEDNYFFVEQYKLQTEYCIGRKTFENSIKLLKEMKLIKYENRWDKKRQIRRRWFRLQDIEITECLDRAQKTRAYLDKQKENRIVPDNRWW